MIILIISSIIVIMREGFPFLIIPPKKGRLLHTGALCFGVESFPVFLFSLGGTKAETVYFMSAEDAPSVVSSETETMNF